MRRISYLVFLGLFFVLWTGQGVVAQSDRSPELNMQFHRAETAWRTGGNLEEARARIDHVLREAPNDGEARKLRAKILLEQERPRDALMDAQQAAFLLSSDAEAHLLLSEAARLIGDVPRALQALQRSAQYADEDADLHLRLSWNAMQLNRLDFAESLGRVALSLDEENPVAYLHLARIFMRQERENHAVQVLRRGFQAEVIGPSAILDDERLSSLAEHEALQDYMP